MRSVPYSVPAMIELECRLFAALRRLERAGVPGRETLAIRRHLRWLEEARTRAVAGDLERAA